MVNGQEYSWQDIQIAFLGRVVLGVTSIKYKEKTAREFIYGTGRKPIAYANGQTDSDGSMTLLQSDFEALVTAMKAAYPNRTFTTLPPFDITTMFIPDMDNPKIVKDVIKDVLLTEYEKGGKVGDLNMPVELPFKCSEIKLQEKI
jgi:hypothetical protein